MTRRIVTALLGLGAVALTAATLPAIDPPVREAAAFGRALAIAGDYAFVGEPGGRAGIEGSVWIFHRGLPRTWQHTGTLTLPAGGSGFGAAVAAEGTTLMVGHVPPRSFARPGAPPPEPEAPGMVHIYTRGSDGSYTAAGLLAAPNVAGSRFGTAIALAGDLALVGAPGEGNGVVHVYRRSNGAWGAAGQLVVDGLTDDAGFGSAIAVDGDRVAVGAPGQDGKGAVYTFVHGDGGWSLETASALASRRLSDNAQFGASLLLMGDHLIVGAPGNNLVPQLAEQPEQPQQRGGFRGGFGGLGMVVAFDRIAASGAWVERGQVTPFDFPTTANFGAALAVVGNELWVGAPSASGTGQIYRVAMATTGPRG